MNDITWFQTVISVPWIKFIFLLCDILKYILEDY